MVKSSLRLDDCGEIIKVIVTGRGQDKQNVRINKWWQLIGLSGQEV